MAQTSHSWTAGEISDRGLTVRWFCQWCGAAGQADIARIIAEKGEAYSMMDRLPLCIAGDCHGMLRFKLFRGAASEWLLTDLGDRRVSQHSEWMFATQIVTQKREAQRRKRQRPWSK